MQRAVISDELGIRTRCCFVFVLFVYRFFKHNPPQSLLRFLSGVCLVVDGFQKESEM